jgi:hypothetical protein
MPVWPKIVYTLNVSLQAAATTRRLRQLDRAPVQQERARGALMTRLAATSFWKQRGIESGMTYSQFQARVPVHTYAEVAPAIEQMKHGRSDVLWPGRCTMFGLTSGTTDGQPRCLPATNELLSHFRRAGFEALLYYTARAGHAGAFRGRHLFYGGGTTLTPLQDGNLLGGFAGTMSGIAALNLPKWAEQHLYEPGSDIAQIQGPDSQLEAIANRTRARDVRLLVGAPHGMVILADALRTNWPSSGKPGASLKDRWRNLECFTHTGALITPYAAELRRSLGPDVMFHDVYAASEGFVAAQDDDGAPGLRLMADMGVFFEFIPFPDYAHGLVEQLGSKAVPIEGVKTGINYAVLLTTPGGLARYVLGDVVRFTATHPPRIIYVGKTELRLNAFGEDVMERDITDVLAALCLRHEWTLVNFHVAPLFSGADLTGQQRGRHEWWIELRPGTVATPTGPQMAAELDSDLQRTCPSYAATRAAGLLAPPVVRLVMPGVFEHWLRFHEKWGGQNKMPRCRSDRVVANEFAQMTNFARD